MPWFVNSLISGIVGFCIGYAVARFQSSLAKQFGDLFAIRTIRGVVIFVALSLWVTSTIASVVRGQDVNTVTSGIMLALVGYLWKQKDEGTNNTK